METYYVGYGHKSIGDLGSATVFIEGVSMLAAKAVQHWPLYNGQESSTRYIDFSQQPMHNPLGSEEARQIQDRWRSFYQQAQEATRKWVRERFPRRGEEEEKVYEKAVTARTFDILRAFLPAGTTTNLAWHGTLRQFADALLPLRHHPLKEVRDIAAETLEALKEAFPSSFSSTFYEATERFYAAAMEKHHFLHPDRWPEGPSIAHDGLDYALLSAFAPLLTARPPKTELPYGVGLAGSLRIEGLLDFGSWRDLQRHRSLTQAAPLLSPRFGFHPWYLAELPPSLREEAATLIQTQEKALAALRVEPTVAQYYLPMGYRVPIAFRGDLRALVYFIELRATRFVHPTLRTFTRRLARVLTEHLGRQGIPLALHLDSEPDRFDVQRGMQDIFVREAGHHTHRLADESTEGR